MVYITAYISEKSGPGIFKDSLAMTVGLLALFGCGLPWLKISLGFTLSKTLMVGLYPFIPISILKLVTAAAIVKVMRRYVPGFTENQGVSTV